MPLNDNSAAEELAGEALLLDGSFKSLTAFFSAVNSEPQTLKLGFGLVGFSLFFVLRC